METITSCICNIGIITFLSYFAKFSYFPKHVSFGIQITIHLKYPTQIFLLATKTQIVLHTILIIGSQSIN